MITRRITWQNFPLKRKLYFSLGLLHYWTIKFSDSLPVIKKKKYSITVGRKPNQNEKKATQSSQESANEEEIEANEERNVSTKECVHILGIFSFLYPCFISFANIIYV